MGSELTLRTFCHENGHMICDYPDLYDYQSDSAGIGHYCLMCYGGNNKNPVQIGAYLKNQSGWATKVVALTPRGRRDAVGGEQRFLRVRQERDGVHDCREQAEGR